MAEHAPAASFYDGTDQEWIASCSCGRSFAAPLRPDAEQARRDHIAAEGIADARASLASALEKEEP